MGDVPVHDSAEVTRRKTDQAGSRVERCDDDFANFPGLNRVPVPGVTISDDHAFIHDHAFLRWAFIGHIAQVCRCVILQAENTTISHTQRVRLGKSAPPPTAALVIPSDTPISSALSRITLR